MERYLSVGEKILLTSSVNEIVFTVDEVIGVGGSCIAYKVSYFENGDVPHKGILKEYCPAFLESNGFTRDRTSINIPIELCNEFSEGLREFKNTYKYINEYLSNNLSATNYHTVQLGLYEGNNTVYTLTSCDYGMSYDKIDDNSLLSICKIMLSVTKAVELYHNAGFLHLDIKPKNILILNEVTELVKLFDFDSLTSIEKLKNREIYGIPVPEDYYVPELQNYDLRNIGIETDIFEIGAMLFTRVFKRSPEVSDMSYDSKYDIDGLELFFGISPQAKDEFIELLRKTLQISKRNRYSTTQELKNKLEKIISLIGEEKPYLMDLPKWQPSKHCLGRKEELKEIKRRLDIDGYVFIKAIGGLGKSEIAKLYAKQYEDEYHTVQFCRFSDSLKSMVATMQINGIDEQNYSNVDELAKAKNKVLHLSDNKTLIIVDNFNVTYDDYLRDFLPANNQRFKVIFTTRCSLASEYYESKTYDLPKLSVNECRDLFLSHCPGVSDDENIELLEKIFEFTDYNTLIIVLMAITIRKSGISLSDMFSKLENQKIDTIETMLFHEYDFSSNDVSEYNRINSHLTTIFNVCRLTEIQREILKNATLISSNGIGVDEFILYCESANVNKSAIKDVIDLGWLNKDSYDVITMHPVVSDLLSANNDLRKQDSYYRFADYLEDYCNPEYCHFSVTLNKLASAKHLKRRYIFESEERNMIISAKLGRLYEDIYQPVDARKYLNEALNIARKLNQGWFVAYIYSFLGSIEKDFGTQSKAIEYYQKCIYEGKKLKNRLYLVVAEAMIAIAECHEDNNDKISAYNSYVEVLKYAKFFRFKELISDIADALVEICKELEWTDKEKSYKKVSDKYRKISPKVEKLAGINEFTMFAKDKDFEGGLVAYEKFLATQREQLGEDSPLYKDLKKGLWAYYALNNQKEQALYLLNENLTFVEGTFGKKSIEMAKELATASSFLLDMTEFESAEKFSEKALKICYENNLTHEYVYVEATFALAKVYLVQGKYNEALNLVNKLDFSKISGNDFLEDAIMASGMAMCQLSKFDEIEPLCLELLKRKNLGSYGRYIANLILSITHERRAKLDEAMFYADMAKECVDNIKTEHIKKTWLVAYYCAVARISFRRGRFEEAISIVSEFIDSFEDDKHEAYILNGAYSDRGLFYLYSGDMQKATEDFEKCEKILKENNLPDQAFATLYNNVAIIYESSGQHEKAREYLGKIVSVNSGVLNPTSYFDAIVCSNLGWSDYNLGNVNQAFDLLKKSLEAFRKLGINNTNDYFRVKNNLAIVYASQENFHEVNKHYTDIRKTYDVNVDPNGEMAVKSNFGIILSLLKLDKAKEAYDFACEDIDRFEAWFGKTSSIRVKAILQMGGLLKEFGYRESYEFFFLADDLIRESGDFKSLNFAKLLNYLGVYETDEEQKHSRAKRYFEKSKELFEELNATDDEAYPIVVKNIEYVKDLLMDGLIGKLAQKVFDETKED